MSPAGGRGYDGPDIEEVLASIRRLIQTSDSSSPSSFAPVGHRPPLSAFPPIGVAREVESERPQPRVMAPCKDTLIARMGQRTFDAPRALSFENKDGPAGERGYGPIPALPSLKPNVGSARGHEVSHARVGQESFLFGRGAADEADDMKEIAPPAERGSASPQSFDVDQTAALLRPILRQWVDDNMKQVFMKALRDAVIATDPKK